MYSIDCSNVLPNTRLGGKSSYEELMKRKPDLSLYQPFGQFVMHMSQKRLEKIRSYRFGQLNVDYKVYHRIIKVICYWISIIIDLLLVVM